MKKLSIIIIFVLLISLVGCIGNYYYNYEDLKESVEEVEIIEITNEGKTIEDFKFIRKLNDEEKDEFMQDLAKIEFVYPFGDPYDFKDGIAFRIGYCNQEYEIISELTTKRYKEDIEISWRKRNCSEEDFENLISKYLNG